MCYINIFNFNQLEAVYRYRDPQLQVGKNYLYLEILQIDCSFFSYILFFERQTKRLKTAIDAMDTFVDKKVSIFTLFNNNTPHSGQR